MNADAATERLRSRGLLVDAMVVANAHHVTLADLLGRRRFKRIALARHAFWRRLRAKYEMSYPEIGWLTGHDHTTVMAACRKGNDDD